MKKLLLVIASFFLFIGCVSAEVKTFDRTTLENYGVNKKWQIHDGNINNVLKTYAVDANDKVYDFANIITEREELELKELINNYYDQTGFDLVILTDDFYNTTDWENEEFASDFYDYNDFGIDDENYSGVIIFRNSYESYPYYAIYSFGDAQFYYSTSGRINTTLDNIYYDMRNANYEHAFKTIIEDLTEYYEDGYDDGMDDYELDENGFLVYSPKFHPPILIAAVISLIATLIIIGIQVSKNKMVKQATLAHDYIDRNSILYTRKSDVFYNSRTTSYTTSSSSGGGYSGGGGGGSRGGSSGGGHSGGGRRG